MMRCVVTSLILAAVSSLALPVLAEAPEAGDKSDRSARGEVRQRMLKEHDKDGDGRLSDDERKAAREAMREKMIKEFDKDGDGKLSDEERQAIRESMRERFGDRKKAGQPGKGKKPGDKKGFGERRRAKDGRGPDAGPRPGGHRGAGGPPLHSPEEMFKKFDADNNDALSREEFMKLTQFVRKHRPIGPPPGGPEGRRGFRERGPDGRGDRPQRDGERRRGDRDREGRPDRPPRDGDRDDGNRGDQAEKADDESA